MSGDEAAPVVVPPVAEPAAIIPEDMDLLTALELTLRKARAHGGVLCKIDSEGNARKVVGCSCLVVKDYGEDTTALNIVKKHIESN
ncbi:hypothetical protein Bca52824_006640 [Brassica carinata]|uniref:40S ribosomal protein S12 n=1 Tax=Brassica carinata TaxID=52824 RepID=A0A8X7W6F3_BRACI|nr:hypothetical protein Bca52824_006640 [Brassica carinata]